MAEGKQEIISFKVDGELAGLIRNIPNRSEFIRKAILSAVEHSCPLCQGSGVITPQQNKHWEEFLKHHTVVKCDDCDALYIECETEPV